jgi:hypothetical protein
MGGWFTLWRASRVQGAGHGEVEIEKARRAISALFFDERSAMTILAQSGHWVGISG